jgi:outer membrane receptor protein involved in Fe transport
VAYTLDNRYNYRRDGLPINAETAIALDNKERLELLKGTSGLQAGTSAPGGLVNLVVKRPNGNHRQARIEWRQAGSVLGAVDIGQRFGTEGHVGLRLNAAHERLDPPTRNTRGERSLLALAGDWQPTPDTPAAGRDRIQPPAPAQRGRLQHAGRHRAQRGRHRPAPQPQRPALAPEHGVRRSDRVAAPGADTGARLAPERARPAAATQERRPHGLPLRRLRRQLQLPAMVRPLCA